ncbi:MAG: hypothetical protein MUF49_00300 [Oculatellaceae cyanobacterium Prado106]|jgi:hypothetical protein|nr:hypothetical protein [Oculatellaceae cyanobacterium Prado106]
MVAVLLLGCIALIGASIRMVTKAAIDLSHPKEDRLYRGKNPRFLIWGVTGYLVSVTIIFFAFPVEAAFALAAVASAMGIFTVVIEKLKILNLD